MSKFIVVEGLDGSGKSTQVGIIKKYLEENGLKYKYLHFPRTDSEIFGDLISKFLRGEFGNVDQVDPYLVALIYAGDRENAKEMILEYLNDGYYVIVDRYVYSNIAFQCAKLEKESEKLKLREWIERLEFTYYSIPKPDISIYLGVPFSFVEKKLSEERSGSERDYLNGKSDIHEQSIELQLKVEKEYLKLVNNEDFFSVGCFDEEKNCILSPIEINKRIFKILREKIVF